MRQFKRILSACLAACLLLCTIPAVHAAESSADTTYTLTGSISATLRIDYAQNLSQLEQRNIRLTLFQGSAELGSVPLYEECSGSLGGHPVQVSHRNGDGGPLGPGSWPEYIDLTVSQLPLGAYTLTFEGVGYQTFSQAVTLDEYAQHVTLGTGDATFTLGDVTGDGKITQADRTALTQALGSARQEDLARYDLNGDGEIDIIDLAYVDRQLDAQGSAEILDTTMLRPPVDLLGMQAALTAGGVLLDGETADLFRADMPAVTLSPAQDGARITEQAPLELSIPLERPADLSQLLITTPSAAGEVLAGNLSVTDSAGNEELFSFDNSLPEDLHGITRTPGTNIITISLGKRVAVKKLTLSITRTSGGEYAVIETIQFLKDIVPETPSAPHTAIRGLTAAAGSGQVRLSWTELPNISGYKAAWREANRDGASWQYLYVDTAQAVISGLDDLTAYEFTVTPTDGSWEGKPSAPVFATPQPAKAPASPDMVSITALDGALNLSWKPCKSATYYELYYTAQENAPISAYQRAGEPTADARATLDGLSNGVTYYLYVIAGNNAGTSAPSQIYSATPQAADYSRPAGIPEGVLEYTDIERVWLADPHNVSPSSYSASAPFQERYMADGDFSTHWTSHSYDDGNWWNNKQVLCTFKRPQDLSAVIWVPRLDGSYRNNLRLYSVTVWTQGEDLNGPGTLIAPNGNWGGSADTHTWPSVRNDPAATRFAVLPFEPVKGVVKIAVTIEQRAYTAVSLSELMFLPYDESRTLDRDISALFTDSLRTKLSAGVDQARIDTLRTRLGQEGNYYLYPQAMEDELTLAEELLNGGKSAGVILNGVESRSSGADSRYQQGGSDLQPLGVAARAGQEITLYASGIPAGQKVTLYASQFNAEASAWRAEIGTVENGRNVLIVPQIGNGTASRGGSLYFTYSGGSPEGIRLHVRRAVDIPLLDLSRWYGMEEAARRQAIQDYVQQLQSYVIQIGISGHNKLTQCLNVTEIATPTVLLSLPAAAVLGSAGKSGVEEQVDTIYNSILAWEDVMHICKTTQGIDNTYEKNDMQSRQNIRCMTMFSGAFMYAAGNHIGIGYGSCGGMVCGRPISQLKPGARANELFGWGIAHEIGHNMDKLGRAEITNNIYAIMVQTYDGGLGILPSRLETSGKYERIFTKTAQGYPGASNDVFVQLGMYWQLHLAYDLDQNPMDFYNRFFKAWKAGTYFNGASSYDDKVALTAAGVAGKDLSGFFTRWGMVLSQSARTKLASYPKEERAVWYLSDQSRRDALSGKSRSVGSVAVSAALQGDNQVLLTITPSITGQVQGYEIRRNGVPIGFTTQATYTDVIGSATHRTYEYTVAAYDTLGYQIAVGSAGQLRVAYDKLVDASAYTMTRSGDTVTITFPQATPISGLKLTGTGRPTSGAYSISITAAFTGEQGQPVTRTVTARTGTFSADNLSTDGGYLTYFNKPGAAGTQDTRIWTYDAKSVVITGIPSSVPNGDIRLVSYAEDDISFLEGGGVGRLAAPLDVGDRVLPAGTLVIAGNYRGDPLFCTIKILGRFTQTAITEDDGALPTEEERYLSGDTYLFAEIPADQQVSDISDGLFLFVPNVQQEAELQQQSSCSGVNLLPSQIQAQIFRTADPQNPDSQHMTASTRWIASPGGADLPAVVIRTEDTAQ